MQPDAHLQLLGELTGHVTHDLANRLAVARLTAELLASRADVPQELAERLRAVVAATSEAGELLQQLAAVAGRRSGPVHALDLADVVQELRPLLVAGLGKRPLRTVVEAAPVVGDRRDLEEVVFRLVLGGRRGADHGDIEVMVAAEGSDAVLRVRRPPEDVLPGDAATRAAALVARADGTLHVAPGEAVVRLPRAATADAAVAERAGGAVVLVVEDDPDLRCLVLDALLADGHDVDAVGDVASALGHPSVVGGRLELLITDVDLPGSSGLDLAAELASAGVRVLVMTGHGEAAVADRLPPGAAVLDKPFGVPDLRSRARAALS